MSSKEKKELNHEEVYSTHDDHKSEDNSANLYNGSEEFVDSNLIDSSIGSEDLSYEVESSSTKDEIFTSIKESTIFENYDIYIDDNVRTVSLDEVDYIEKGMFRTVKVDTVIQNRRVVRHGAASVSYYQFFDRILSGSIYADAYRIGSLLKNRSFIRSILFSVLNSLPNRVNRNSNGFLRSNMMLSRNDIHNCLHNALSKMMSRSREPYRRRFIKGFSSILEVVLISKLVSNKLLDITEMDQKMIVEIRDDVIDDMSYDDVRTVIASSQIHNVILKIINSTDNIITLDDNLSRKDNNYNVDIDDIIHKVLTSIDEISDYLIMHEVRKSDIDLVFTIASLHRDRLIYSMSDDYRQLLDEVNEIVIRYNDSFEMLFRNFNFNVFMNQFRTEAALNLLNEGRGYLTIHAERISRTLMEIRRAFDNPLSMLQIVDKREFLEHFTIVNRTNSLGRVYHSFVRRNFSSLKGTKSFETISQFLDPNRDIVFPDLGRDKDLFMIISNSHYNQGDLDGIVNTLPFLNVLAQERSYSSYLDNLMFRFFNGALVQGCMLFKHDTKKLAYLLSDEVIELYCDYALDLVKLARDNNFDSLAIDNDRPTFGIPIYIKRGMSSYSNQREYYTFVAGNQCILTKIPEKIISLSESIGGNSSLSINSSMLQEGRFVLSEDYVNAAMNDDIIIWPSRSGLRVEVNHALKEGGIPNFLIELDFADLCKTSNGLSRVISTRDHYIDFMEEYVRVLRLFQHTIGNLAYHAVELIGDSDLDTVTTKYRDLSKFISNASDNGVVQMTMISTVDDTRELFKKTVVASQFIEQGLLFPFNRLEEVPLTDTSIALQSDIDKVTVLNTLSDIVRYRQMTLKSMSYQAFLINVANKFYSGNRLFKNFVDKAMSNIHGPNGDRYLTAINIIRMFAEGTDAYISKYITSKTILVAINLLYSFLTNNVNIDQIFRSGRGRNVEGVDKLLNDPDNFMGLMLNLYDIINLRDVAALETLTSKELHNDGLSSVGNGFRIDNLNEKGSDAELYTYSSISNQPGEPRSYRNDLTPIEKKFLNPLYGDQIRENNEENGNNRRDSRR